jgi:hypothetical protein
MLTMSRLGAGGAISADASKWSLLCAAIAAATGAAVLLLPSVRSRLRDWSEDRAEDLAVVGLGLNEAMVQVRGCCALAG